MGWIAGAEWESSERAELAEIERRCREEGCPRCKSQSLDVVSLQGRLLFACRSCESVGLVEVTDAPVLN